MDQRLLGIDGAEPYAFISFSHQDEETVLKEIDWLREQGVNVWYDADIQPGLDWTEALAQAIKNASLFIFFVTPRSVESEHCRRELRFALEKQILIVAVYLVATDPPEGIRFSLDSLQAIYKHKLSGTEYRQRLSNAIQLLANNSDIAESKANTSLVVRATSIFAVAATISFLVWVIVSINFSDRVPASTENPPYREYAGVTLQQITELLPSPHISSFAEDIYGNIWIGTQAGLAVHDGHGLRVFEHDPELSSSLSDDFVTSIQAAPNGDVWVGSLGGLDRYLQSRSSFQRLVPTSSSQTLKIQNVLAVKRDTLGNLWIGTSSGLICIDSNGAQIRHFVGSESGPLPNGRIHRIYEDSSKNIWIGTDRGLARFDLIAETFDDLPSPFSAFDESSFTAIFEDRRRLVWLALENEGLFRFDPVTKEIKHVAVEDAAGGAAFRDLIEDSRGNLWLASNAGLLRWSPEKDLVELAKPDKDLSSQTRVSRLFESSSGALWIGSNGGVRVRDRQGVQFRQLQTASGHLKSDTVTSIASSSSRNWWVGTYGGGVSEISPQNVTLRSFDDSNTGYDINTVMAVTVDSRDWVWVGTRYSGLFRFDGRAWAQFKTPMLSSNRIASLYAERDGTLWIGTYGGGLERLSQDGELETFAHKPANPSTIANDYVLTIFRDSDGVLWIGSDLGGLSRFHEQTRTFSHFTHDPLEEHSLPGDRILDIAEGRDGSLWIATSGGLSRWLALHRRAGSATFTNWSKADGLPTNQVQSVVEDRSGAIWLGTDQGLARLDPYTNDLQVYDDSNGLLAKAFNSGAAARDETERLAFGSLTGLLVFRP